MQITTQMLADHFGMDKQTVWRLLSFMEKTGNATPVGKIPAAGKGRPSFVYEIPDSVTFDFSSITSDVEYKQEAGEKYLTAVTK